MNKTILNRNISCPGPLDISDEDVLNAMRDIQGYLDITPADAKELYRFAYRHAIKRLTHSVRAGDVMTKAVICVKRDTSLGEVAELMAHHGVSGVPVVGGGGMVVGIISEKDFLHNMDNEGASSFMGILAHSLKRDGCIALSILKCKAKDIMKSPAVTVEEDTPVSEIAGIFMKKNINRVPVVDGKGKLIGIISRADIVQSSSRIIEK